jgi:DNA-binding NtrC family response regulator
VIPLRLPALRERREDIPLLVEHFLQRHNARLQKDIREIPAATMERLMGWSWPGNIRELENVVERGVLLSEGEVLDVDLPGGGSSPVSDDGSDVDLKEWIQNEVARLEKAKIQKILELEGGNVTRAARRLHISRKGLQLKMKEYGLREEPE